MDIHLNRASDIPLYLQVKEHIKSQIEDGLLPPLTRLPPTRELAESLGVNRVTIVNAYAELEVEGLIAGHVGRGTYVLDQSAVAYAGFGEQMLPPAAHHSPSPTLMEWSVDSVVREAFRLARRPDVISFAPGVPAPDLLPVGEFRQALNTVLRRDGVDAVQYGEVEGYYPLRATMAELLQSWGIKAAAEDVLIASGCQQAMAVACLALVRHGDAVAMEAPTYPVIMDLLRSLGAHIVPIPVDEHGMQVELLEHALKQQRIRLICVSPTYQNPMGVSLDIERRQMLLELSRNYSVPVLEDDSYRGLDYDHTSPPPLRAMPGAEQVIYAGGFSKTFLPAVRVGYLVVPHRLQKAMVAAKQTIAICTSEVLQRAVSTYLSSGGWLDHLAQLRQAYRERRDAMLDAATTYLPGGTRWTRPAGGFYQWVTMPSGPGAIALYLKAVEHGVAFAVGNVFYPDGRGTHTFRLSFASHKPETIQEGMRRLGIAWQALLEEKPEAPERRLTSRTSPIF